MGRGPHKPSALHILEGGRSHSRTKADDAAEPQPQVRMPKCPQYLDSTARRIFKELGPMLVEYKMLTTVDEHMFAAVCQIASRVQFIGKELKREENRALISEKISFFGRDREVHEEVIHPLVNEERKYMELLFKGAGHFGLSPRTRRGIQMAGGADDFSLDI